VAAKHSPDGTRLKGFSGGKQRQVEPSGFPFQNAEVLKRTALLLPAQNFASYSATRNRVMLSNTIAFERMATLVESNPPPAALYADGRANYIIPGGQRCRLAILGIRRHSGNLGPRSNRSFPGPGLRPGSSGPIHLQRKQGTAELPDSCFRFANTGGFHCQHCRRRGFVCGFHVSR